MKAGSTPPSFWFIDDHPFIVDGYRQIVWTLYPKDTCNIQSFSDFQSVIESIQVTPTPPDWVWLDDYLLGSILGRNNFGTDLLAPMQASWGERMPKVIIISNRASPIDLADWLKYPAVMGVYLKSDLTFQLLQTNFQRSIEGHMTLTPEALRFKNILQQHPPLQRSLNRTLIRALMMGLKGESIAQRLQCSLSAVNKHKNELKIHFTGGACSDEVLLQALRQLHII